MAPCSPCPKLCLQAYLAFGDQGYLDMFKEVYAAAMTSLQLDPSWNGNIWWGGGRAGEWKGREGEGVEGRGGFVLQAARKAGRAMGLEGRVVSWAAQERRRRMLMCLE